MYGYLLVSLVYTCGCRPDVKCMALLSETKLFPFVEIALVLLTLLTFA